MCLPARLRRPMRFIAFIASASVARQAFVGPKQGTERPVVRISPCLDAEQRMLMTASCYDLRDPASAQAFCPRRTNHRRCPVESHRQYLVCRLLLEKKELLLTFPTHNAPPKGHDVQLIAARSMLARLPPGAP